MEFRPYAWTSTQGGPAIVGLSNETIQMRMAALDILELGRITGEDFVRVLMELGRVRSLEDINKHLRSRTSKQTFWRGSGESDMRSPRTRPRTSRAPSRAPPRGLRPYDDSGDLGHPCHVLDETIPTFPPDDSKRHQATVLVH